MANNTEWEVFEQTKIQLPIFNGKINFSFMENFIAQLEAERLAQLNLFSGNRIKKLCFDC